MAGLLTVRRSSWKGVIGTPKSGRERKVPLTRRLRVALKASAGRFIRTVLDLTETAVDGEVLRMWRVGGRSAASDTAPHEHSRAGVDLVAVHNMDPIWVPACGPAFPELGGAVTLPGETDARRRQERLIKLTRALPVPVTPVVTSLVDPVSAIVEEARARKAGLIVVGTRQRRTWERLLSGSTATQVVNRTTFRAGDPDCCLGAVVTTS